MPEISVQKQPASITDLVAVDSFGTPVGPLPEQLDGGFFEGEFGPSELAAGTWTCDVGTLELDLDVTEFCHLLAGHWKFTSVSGQVDEVKAGDSWVFPQGWKGTAEVIEKVHKVYLMLIPAQTD
ncbi:MAG: cupin domain-containing protein [Pseudomonadota bacterium]